MSAEFYDECPVRDERASDDTHARLLFERGDMGVLPGRRYPGGLGNSERAQIWRAVMGPSEEDFAEEYEAEAQREFPDRFIRKRWPRPGTSSPGANARLIDASKFRELYNAVALANRHGAVLDTHVTVSWSLLGYEADEEASAALQFGLIKPMREWFRHQGDVLRRPFAHIYAHERGAQKGLHTHLLVFIPIEWRPAFDAWLRKRERRLAHRSLLPKERAIDVTPARRDRHRQIWHQWFKFGYLMKTVDPEAMLPVYPGRSATVPLTELVPWDWESPGQVKCRLRVGSTREPPDTALAGVPFRSLLDRGVADVRLLFSDWDYREWEWAQRKAQIATLFDPESAKWLTARVTAERAEALKEHRGEIAAWLRLVRRREAAVRKSEEASRKIELMRRIRLDAVARLLGANA